MNLELDAPEKYKYLVAFRNFSQSQVYHLNRYVMETFLADKVDVWDITERGQLLINIAKHICFLCVNEKLVNKSVP